MRKIIDEKIVDTEKLEFIADHLSTNKADYFARRCKEEREQLESWLTLKRAAISYVLRAYSNIRS